MAAENSPTASFKPWREEVNRILLRDYYVDLDIAGIDEEYLLEHYGSSQMSADFVEWFAVKYDLYDFKW